MTFPKAILTPQRLHAELLTIGAESLESYLQGALRDGTRSALHKTHRFGQSDIAWVQLLQEIIKILGYRSWIYREGRDRNMWIVETTAPVLSVSFDATPLVGQPAGLAYVKGYFDAEGGMPKDPNARLYLQLTQKNRPNLETVLRILKSWDIDCGRVHNPSHKIDPNYWRFYVLSRSHERFLRLVGSWHPRKRQQIAVRLDGYRMKI